jgi:hypothetical protein
VEDIGEDLKLKKNAVSNLERLLNHYTSEVVKRDRQNEQLKEKLDIAEDALEFYSDKKNWLGYHREVDTIIREDREKDFAESDGFEIWIGGKRAREALKAIKDEK